MNVFEVLKQDHQKVRELFAQLHGASEDGRRKVLFGELKHELIAHAHAEEKIFYPPLNRRAQTHGQIQDSLQEHHDVEAMLQKMERMDTASDQWRASLDEVEKAVEHHVHEEETQVFPKASQLLPAESVDRMAGEIKQAEAGDPG